MHASARIVASAGDRLDVLYGEPPLLPRRTGPHEVHFVGGAAGPLGGDRLRIDLCVRAGACLVVRSVAATIAYPGRDGALSQLDVHATVESGGRLEWLPEPLIAVGRCNHRTTSTVDLFAGAALVWRDELVCGRHGEGPGDVRLLTSVHVEKRPLYVHELAVGPSVPGWSGAAVLGGARVHASTVYVGTSPPAGAGTVMELAGGGTVVTAVGPDLASVRG